MKTEGIKSPSAKYHDMAGSQRIPHKNPHIQKVAVLQSKPNKEDALNLIKEIAHKVSYLMKENHFKVTNLVEFYPRDQRLLGMNVNHGSKIMLRLRCSTDEFQFLPMECIMGTMLHELTHNLFGPHDKKFYNKLDELIGRQWVIEQRGLYDTFLGNGQRLGGRANLRSNRYPMTGISTNTGIVRKRGKGVKLGSLNPEGISSIDRGNSPRELAAFAAERRYRDDRWCGETKNNKDQIISDNISSSLEVVILDDDDEVLPGDTLIEVIDLT
ncbi:Wss1p [Saccharomyces cerevisiae FostersB]|nr:Wss1p [Saccharomyces cerevisiae YJM1341]EGA58381.1 Wss1p [Saccharomyces cerevisiae FostersB]CAI4509951.1 BLD_1a_G0024600.mRNA.1.CDS.1 [Saccharomyces cerevisiae]CAI7153652.1 BLD_1a_G0024600.mRNA.1.CDS.1 [Saccharomyces cerevisiae]